MKTASKTKPVKEKPDVNALITDKFIEAIEKGVSPFITPWSTAFGMPRNCSGRCYRGINFFLTLLYCQEFDWDIPVFMTYKQAKENGWQVREGEKSVKVSFSSLYVPKEYKANPSACPRELQRFYRRLYSVFNVSQIEGVDLESFVPSTFEFEPIETANRIVDGYENGPPISHSGGRAYYSPSLGSVTLPAIKNFHASTGYYEVLFHELAHSTGHPDRLAREFGKMGTTEYAFEELVAELTASFLCAESGFLDATFENSASYLASWLEHFKSDNTYLIKAASKAQLAADHILGRSFN